MTTTRHRPIPPRWRAVVSLVLVALSVAPFLAMLSLMGATVRASAAVCVPSIVPCEGAGNTGDGTDLWRGIDDPGGGSGGGGSGDPGNGIDCDLYRYQVPECMRDPIEAVDPEEPARPPLSLFDLRHFVPDSPQLETEPHGWTIQGLLTNLMARATTHSRSGSVLGVPVEVVFTPVSYAWAFGDGTSGDTVDAGAPWAQLGVPEFGPTETAHVYATSGTFWPAVAARYSVRYRYVDTDWRRVSGTVTAWSANIPLVVTRFDRALGQLG